MLFCSKHLCITAYGNCIIVICPFFRDVNGKEKVTWPEFDLHHRKYLELDLNIREKRNFMGSRMKFWIEDVPKMLKDSGDSTFKSPSGCLFYLANVLFIYYIFN